MLYHCSQTATVNQWHKRWRILEIILSENFWKDTPETAESSQELCLNSSRVLTALYHHMHHIRIWQSHKSCSELKSRHTIPLDCTMYITSRIQCLEDLTTTTQGRIGVYNFRTPFIILCWCLQLLWDRCCVLCGDLVRSSHQAISWGWGPWLHYFVFLSRGLLVGHQRDLGRFFSKSLMNWLAIRKRQITF